MYWFHHHDRHPPIHPPFVHTQSSRSRLQLDTFWFALESLSLHTPFRSRARPRGATMAMGPDHEPCWTRGRNQRYAKLSVIDSGSFGKVYMSIDTITGQPVATKVQSLPCRSAAREFACLSLLSSFPCQHIMVMIDHWVRSSAANGQELCIVYPLADTCLWRLFQAADVQQGLLPPSHLAQYLVGVAKGLSHMHSLHVVHADASLKNMLLCRGGIVNVADFGTSHTAHTVLGGRQLTTGYVNAPEMWLGQQGILPAIDIWAWGVMLYMLSSGRCDWLSATKVEEVIPSMEKVAGPIDETSWPGYSDMPKWNIVARHRAESDEPHAEGSGTRPEIRQSFLAALQWSPARRSWDAVFGCDLLQAHYPGLARPSLFSDSEGSLSHGLAPQQSSRPLQREDALQPEALEPRTKEPRVLEPEALPPKASTWSNDAWSMSVLEPEARKPRTHLPPPYPVLASHLASP